MVSPYERNTKYSSEKGNPGLKQNTEGLDMHLNDPKSETANGELGRGDHMSSAVKMVHEHNERDFDMRHHDHMGKKA